MNTTTTRRSFPLPPTIDSLSKFSECEGALLSDSSSSAESEGEDESSGSEARMKKLKKTILTVSDFILLVWMNDPIFAGHRIGWLQRVKYAVVFAAPHVLPSGSIVGPSWWPTFTRTTWIGLDMTLTKRIWM
jgi:hypothetical protein